MQSAPHLSHISLAPALPRLVPGELVRYFGVVNYATNDRVLGDIERRLVHAPGREIQLLITSAGGPSGTAMSFYDAVRLLRAPLMTIGAGDVDSSGLIIFLSGSRRFVTPHTTALLHPAGRAFNEGKRYTALELAAMLAEDKLKDEQYTQVVAASSGGRLAAAEVARLMERHTVLSAGDFVELGLAEAVLQ